MMAPHAGSLASMIQDSASGCTGIGVRQYCSDGRNGANCGAADGKKAQGIRIGHHLVRLRETMIPLSVLDLAPIVEGGDAAQSFRNSLDLAQHAERWDYQRFWLAEHHGMPGIASAATAVLIGHVAGGTSRIRVGAGGIMLPNHSPLVIAEQFGTLASLYPGPHRPRPGPRARLRPGHRARAAPQPAARTPTSFRRTWSSCRIIFPTQPRQQVRAVPGTGAEGAAVDPRLEPVRRAAGGRARPAVRVRLALRAAADDAGDRAVPRALSSRRRSSTSRT